MQSEEKTINKHESLNDITARFRARGPALSEQIAEVELVSEEVKEVRMKHFPDEVASLPNEWTRSGLFAASSKVMYVLNPFSQKKERVLYSKRRMPSFSDNVELNYTGYHLNTFDLRVYLTAIRESKNEYLKRYVSLTPYQFCEASRIPRCGKNKEAIYQSLDRLSSAHLSSETYGIGKNGQKKRLRFYHDHLIYKFRDNKEKGTWDISLSDELAQMFAYQTSWIDWETWNSLKGEIPKALMLQICSHEAHPNNPQKIRLEKLKEILRLESPLIKCKQLFKKAGIPLLEKGVVKTWHCDDAILTFSRLKKA